MASPQTGGEDQFFTQYATDIHKIRPLKREAGERGVGEGKGSDRDGDKENGEWVQWRRVSPKEGCTEKKG